MDGLTRLLRPRNIAVIGGGTWCANVVRACAKMGFAGDVWPVHPARSEVAGTPAFASFADLPAAPDASFIGINRTATIDALRELNAMGAGGAVCFASGFAEAQAELADGADLQAELLAAAGDLAVLGPNCYGILNYFDKSAIWPDQHGGAPVKSGVAIITQSSNIAINLTMQTRGTPLGYVVTAGNQAQTDIAEIGIALLQDERVSCLGLHIEGINNIRSLERLSKVSHELGKPIAVLKIGTSEEARAATMSHTASLAGSAAGGDALIARLGFAQVRSLPVFLELLKLWHVAGPLPHSKVVSASCSGGEASLMADAASHLDVSFPKLTEPQTTPLRVALGPKVALANPLDYHTYIWPDTDAMCATFSALVQDDLALGLVVLDFPRSDRCDASEWDNVVEAVARTWRETGQRMAIVSSLTETLPEDICDTLIDLGIVPFSGLDHALEAISLGVAKPRSENPVLLPLPPESPVMLDEYGAKAALKAHGLAIPGSVKFAHEDIPTIEIEAMSAPFVLKGMGLAHKSEAGAVKLGLQSAEVVRTTAQDMKFDTYLVEEMIQNQIFEMLVGVTLDPAHGYVLTLGAGGTRTEILQDTVSLLLPVNQTGVIHALDRLKHAPILAGFRGAPACDMDAIWRAVDAVQRFVIAEHGRVSEVEINPLICTEDDAIAVDALIILGD